MNVRMYAVYRVMNPRKTKVFLLHKENMFEHKNCQKFTKLESLDGTKELDAFEGDFS